jgi:septal ring factor EnvC (AmiA/AmiB activator)
MLLRALFVVTFALFSSDALAQKTKSDLDKINADIKQKRMETAKLDRERSKLTSEINSTQKRLVNIASNIRTYEKQLSDYDKKLMALRADEKAVKGKLDASQDALVKLVAAFQNMALVPKGYSIMNAKSAEDMFRTSTLLASITSQMAKAKEEFTEDLNRLIMLEQDITKARINVHSTTTRIKDEQTQVNALVKSKQATAVQMDRQRESNRAAIERLVKESKSIEEFIRKAEAMRKASGGKEIVRSFSGNVSLPATGAIAAYYGEMKSGIKSKGIYVKVRDGMQVISPVDADVVFAGNFLGHKNLLILHGADGFYIVMGGMRDVFTNEGQGLLAGEPVGVCGDGELYIEIRDGENTVNPVKYFKL